MGVERCRNDVLGTEIWFFDGFGDDVVVFGDGAFFSRGTCAEEKCVIAKNDTIVIKTINP